MSPLNEATEGHTLTSTTNNKLITELERRRTALNFELGQVDSLLEHYRGSRSSGSGRTPTRTSRKRVTRSRTARTVWRSKILSMFDKTDSIRMADVISSAGRQGNSVLRSFRDLEKEGFITKTGEYRRSPMYSRTAKAIPAESTS